jgi:hypothetical protein
MVEFCNDIADVMLKTNGPDNSRSGFFKIIFFYQQGFKGQFNVTG